MKILDTGSVHLSTLTWWVSILALETHQSVTLSSKIAILSNQNFQETSMEAS